MITFQYDSNGNPIARRRSDWSETGLALNYYFIYDSIGRLSDLIIPRYDTYDSIEPGTIFQSWHRYKYDSQNRIIYDSVYAEGYIGKFGHTYIPVDNFYNTMSISEVRYEYDFKNRITGATAKFLSPTYNYTGDYSRNEFVYDYKNLKKRTEIYYNQDGSAGNSYVYDFLTYDDKINLNSTHPVFQFLNRDFSLNNPDSVADFSTHRLILEYNNHHLPVNIGVQHGDYYNTNFTDVLIAAPFTVTYENS